MGSAQNDSLPTGFLSHGFVFTNCSDILPFSDDFFTSITTSETAGVAVCGVLAAAVVLLFLDNACFVIRRYLHHKTKVLSLWMLGIHPIFALTAIIAVCIPRAAMLSDLVAAIYLSLCLRVFLVLMIHYHGGELSLIDRMKDDHINLRSPPICCCCCCCPKIKINRKNLIRIKLCVWQVAFLRPFIVFLSAVMWADGKYVKGKVGLQQAYVYLTVITIVSTFLAIYGLQLICRASGKHLKDFNIIPKFLNMQLTLVFSNVQGLIFSILARFDLPPCKGILSSSVRGDALHHLLLVAEMFLLALLARCYYRRIDGVQTISDTTIAVSVAGEKTLRVDSDSEKVEPYQDLVKGEAIIQAL